MAQEQHQAQSTTHTLVVFLFIYKNKNILFSKPHPLGLLYSGECFPPFSVFDEILQVSCFIVESRNQNKAMEVVRSQRKSSVPNDAVSTLPLYRSAPPLEVRLEDFEFYAIDRLRGN